MSWGASNDDGGWGSTKSKEEDSGLGSTKSKDDDGGWVSGPTKKEDDGWGSGPPKNTGWGSRPPRRDNNDGGRGPRQPRRNDNGGGGSLGSRQPKRDDNGWGSTKPKENDGGWGSGPSKDDDGGWGSAPSKGDDNGRESRQPREDDGGWGSTKSNNWGSSDNNESESKRFKRDPEGNDQESRPAPFKPEELDLDEEAKLQGDGAGENFKRYQDQEVTCLPADCIKPIEKFTDFITSELLLKNVETQKYAGMTPIQKWSIPAILNNHDLIGCAQTGSGKTAAFLLPILQRILDLKPESYRNEECQHPYCLIISPTRELAHQINVHANMLAKDSVIKCHVLYGQISTGYLKSRLATGCHILVATPGRLKDFVQRGWIGFKNIKYVILDEGDRLVDEGFTADIAGFFNHESMPPKEDRQTLFFSATFKEETQLNARKYLKDNFLFLTVGRVGAANEDIKQEFVQVSRMEKKRELKKILKDVPETDKTIVFTETKVCADILAAFFTAQNLSSTSIHGDRTQPQREQAIKAFRKGEKRFLISSPVGNRGLDLPKVSLVINYDLPKNIDEYVHRIGRTGRAGHTGRAISFYDAEHDGELLPQLIEILTEAGQEIPDWMTGGEAQGGDVNFNQETSGPAEATSETNANDGWGNNESW